MWASTLRLRSAITWVTHTLISLLAPSHRWREQVFFVLPKHLEPNSILEVISLGSGILWSAFLAILCASEDKNIVFISVHSLKL